MIRSACVPTRISATPANPRIPLINDMKDIAVGAYYGVSQAEGHKLRIEREGEAATEEASER